VAVNAADTVLTIKNNTGFEQNDYVIIGQIGQEKTELKQVNAAVAAGTALTVTALTFAHDIDTPIYRVDFDQVAYYHATVASTTPAPDLLPTGAPTPIDITPDSTFSRYEDTEFTTGYGFVRFYNSTTGDYSVYSAPIPYSGYTNKMFRNIRQKVRRLLNEPDDSVITDGEIDDEIDLAQKEIAHDRMWSFYEKTKSFSSVANQYEYSLASDCYKLFDSKFDSQPLAVMGLKEWNIHRWDTDVTGDPTKICIWRNKARVYPYPSDSAETTTVGVAVVAGDTTITVADASEFREQGRVLIGTEVIGYTGTTATTLTGCVRGIEDTADEAHAVGDTVTERDFIYHFQEEPDVLDAETDATAISEPSLISYKASAELALQVDKETLHDRLLAKYDRGLAQLRKVDGPKWKGRAMRVKDYRTIIDDEGMRDPNQYPTNIS